MTETYMEGLKGLMSTLSTTSAVQSSPLRSYLSAVCQYFPGFNEVRSEVDNL